MDQGVYRIMDANLNRVMEGLRVCEDIMRFSSNDEKMTARFKDLRHDIFLAVKDIQREHLGEMVSSRDVNDVGVKSNESEKTRDDITELFFANAQRGKESLRVLEEILKLFDADLSQKFKKFRFKLYDMEKTAVEQLSVIGDVR
ncbi:MAG: thiamine-phosphate pyrophosphorylase [Candidatus Omnitrophota bacterium]